MSLNIAKMIDHTLLTADATKSDIIKLCNEAKEYNFFSVCVNPYWVKIAAKELENSKVKVCTVVGFPLGASVIKAYETELALNQGATEFDMVINIGALKDKHDEVVSQDISDVVKCAKGSVVKVILEICLLTDEEIARACKLAEKAGAHYVKTSTGFSTSGASLDKVKLMSRSTSSNVHVKASGGIRTYQDALQMIEAGASRIGTSNSVNIVS